MDDLFTRPVYAYYLPEVREIITRISKNYPHELYLQSIKPGLDDYHKPIIEKYLTVFKDYMPGLIGFPYRYVSAGSSEAIFHVLAEISSREHRPPLYVVEGEYEGYRGYGGNLGLQFMTVPDGFDPRSLAQGIFFISNPSSRDGNAHSNDFIRAIGDAGHEIILDCTYVGMTAGTGFLVDHPAISTVITSMSKTFGMYYYRVGFAFTRKPMPTLEVNKWFKNIFSLAITDAVLSTLSLKALYTKYSAMQKDIVTAANGKYGVALRPSEVYLLAYIHEENLQPASEADYAHFHRGGAYYRFGLTPEFLRRERG